MASTSSLPPPPRATSIIVIGMAGSGKSSFVAKLAEHTRNLAQQHKGKQKDSTSSSASGSASGQQLTPEPAYCVNLDPAVATLGYEPNVDIRDTIDYSRVMEE